MTPRLEAAIAAIQPLSPSERQQLLQILLQSPSSANAQADLETLSTQFRQGITLQQLLIEQTPTTVTNLSSLATDCFPEEDSIEEFLSFLQQQRQSEI